MEDVNYTLDTFSKLKGKLESGVYASEGVVNISKVFKDLQKK